MIVLGRSAIALRLCALLAFLGYLLAGASLALPAELRCARCARIGKVGAMRPGASCPLSYHGHDCHTAQKKTAGQIVLCPDGCLRHDGQGGEVPSLAKFLSAPISDLFDWLPASPAVEEIPFSLLEPSLPPPHHPPPSHS
ncbi:MAG: hypothetical protein HYZ72_18650 [Deltaproteobacteria bacterium]|nr:hypothetical protein [Deltaproteobacteria bacterium]